jgi:hypothetical protein
VSLRQAIDDFLRWIEGGVWLHVVQVEEEGLVRRRAGLLFVEPGQGRGVDRVGPSLDETIPVTAKHRLEFVEALAEPFLRHDQEVRAEGSGCVSLVLQNLWEGELVLRKSGAEGKDVMLRLIARRQQGGDRRIGPRALRVDSAKDVATCGQGVQKRGQVAIVAVRSQPIEA